MKIIVERDTLDPNQEYCTICRTEGSLGVEAVATVNGGANCGYCGNSVNLCRKHLRQTYRELKAVYEVWT